MQSKARFILSRAAAIAKYEEIKQLADSVSYSLKTNYDVGKVLEAETDCKFSVHSIPELMKLADPQRAWFFAQGWTESESKEIFGLGVKSFVVDNQNDLDVLLNALQNSAVKINLMLRMRLKEHTIYTGKHFVFGFYSSQISELIPKLRENKSIAELGIHFHRKTQNVSEWSVKEELESNISKEVLSAIDAVNIGGGMPAKYKNFREEVYDYIFRKINELRKWLNLQSIKMIIEPGRIIAAPAVKLETNIINKYDNNLVVDCSVYNAAMDSFIVHNRLLVEGELEKGQNFTIKGCTPDSLDIFRYSVFLNEPKIGGKIVFLNAGAYNFASDFCMLPKIETVIE